MQIPLNGFPFNESLLYVRVEFLHDGLLPKLPREFSNQSDGSLLYPTFAVEYSSQPDTALYMSSPQNSSGNLPRSSWIGSRMDSQSSRYFVIHAFFSVRKMCMQVPTKAANPAKMLCTTVHTASKEQKCLKLAVIVRLGNPLNWVLSNAFPVGYRQATDWQWRPLWLLWLAWQARLAWGNQWDRPNSLHELYWAPPYPQSSAKQCTIVCWGCMRSSQFSVQVELLFHPIALS